MQENANAYAGWEPVRINAGSGSAGFFFDDNGLEWLNAPGEPNHYFAGWLGKRFEGETHARND